MATDIIAIKFGSHSYNMRPSFEVYRDVEQQTDLTINELFMCALNERLKLEEAAIIVMHAANAAGEKFALEGVMHNLFQQRLTNPAIRGPIMKLLLALQYTPEEALKKYEAEVADLLGWQEETT